jgi:hypothetical protein
MFGFPVNSERPKPEIDFWPKAEISVHSRNRILAETKISIEMQFLAETDYKSEKINQNSSKYGIKFFKTDLAVGYGEFFAFLSLQQVVKMDRFKLISSKLYLFL